MQNLEQKITDKEAISNWEDEGGALKPAFIAKKKDHKLLIWVGILIGFSFSYWLAARKNRSA